MGANIVRLVNEKKVIKEEFKEFKKKLGYEQGKSYNLNLQRRIEELKDTQQDKEKIFITSKGAYWVHRVQNEYSLSNIQKIWGTCISNPWPDEVKF